MSDPINKLLGILKDPPPEFVFEIGAGGIGVSRAHNAATVQRLRAPGRRSRSFTG